MEPSSGNNLLPPQVSRGDDPTKLAPNPKKPAVRFERTVSQAPSTHLGASNHSVGGRRIVEALDRGVFTSRTPGSTSSGRNLVVCIDGTSNQFGTKNTNVVKLYSAVEKSDQQLSYYNSGIGTYADPSWKSWTYVKQVIDNKVDLAIAWNFEKIVLGAYRWLCDNWREGDKIYLFGFSRGAYQVRTLAGMIQRVGLLYPGNAEQIPFAYELYSKQARKQKAPKPKPAGPMPVPTIHIEVEAASPSDSKSPEEKSTGGGTVGKSSGTMPTIPASRAASGTHSLSFLKAPFSGTPAHEPRRDLAAHFKSTFSREDVKVHFVGVWDTVSSIGIFRGKALPLTDSADHVTYFRHALALDERRVKFLPEYVNGGCCSLGDETRSMDDGGLVHIKEVWFPGTHSDIGGGNSFNPDPVTLENAPYLWMSAEAASCGLKLKVPVVDSLWERPSEIKESLEWPWYPLEIVPFRVLAYTDSSKTLVGMHRGRGRQMQHNQKLHPSIAYCAPEYKPKAKLPPGETRNFSSIVGMGADQDKTGWRESWQDVLEDDITDLRALLQHLASCTKQEESGWQYRISLLTSTDKGCQRLLETGHIIQLATIFTAKPTNSELHDFVLNILEKLCGSAPTTIRGHALRVWCSFSARSLERPDDRRLAVRCLAYSLYTAYITSQEQRQGDDRSSKAIDEFKETLVTLKKEKPGLDVLLEATIKDLTSPATLNPPLSGKEGGAENLATTAIVADAVDDIPNDVHNIDLNFAQASLLEEVDGCPVGLQLCSKNKGLADLLLTHGLMETILETTQQQPMKTFSRTLFYFCSALEQDILDPPRTQAVIDYVGLAFYSHFPPTPVNTDSSAIQCRILNFLAASIAHVGKTWLWTEATVLTLIDSLSNQGIRQCVIDTLRASLDQSCVATIMSTPRIISEFRKLLGSNIPSMNRLAVDFFMVSASSSDVNFCDRVWSGETVQQLRELLSHGDWKRRLASVECFSQALSNIHIATSVFKPEVIAQIEERLSDTDADVVAKTVELYSKADKVSEALQDELWKASVLKRCLELLSWDSWYIRRSVVDLSRAVLSQPRFQSDQASSKAMINGLKDNWLGVLRDGDDAVRDSAAGMLTSTTGGNAKDNLWTTEVSDQLQRQLEGGTSERLLAINSLLIATAQPQLYERVFTPEIVKSFFNCLSSWSNWTIRLRALDVLEAIAKQDQVYEPMWNDQTVKVLRERLNDHDYDVRSKALDCLTAAVAKEPLLKIITLETVIDAIEHQMDANSSSWRARCAAISLMKEALIHDRFAGHYEILHPHDRSRIHWNLRHSVSDYDEDVRASALDFLIVVASRAGPLLHQVFDDDMITAIRSRARDDIPRVSDAYWELVKQLSETHHASWAHLITVHDVTSMLEGFYEGNAEEREHSKLQLEELLSIEELRHLFVAGLSARAATRFQLSHT